MTREEMEMRKLVRESDVIDKTNGTELARAFNTLWNKYIEKEPNDDCIARQPLIDNWNSCADMLMGEGDAEVVMGWIFDAPSVTPTRKKGKWIINSDFPDELICSCCNTNYDMWFWEQGSMKYCPNCGAKMAEGEDKE